MLFMHAGDCQLHARSNFVGSEISSCFSLFPFLFVSFRFVSIRFDSFFPVLLGFSPFRLFPFVFPRFFSVWFLFLFFSRFLSVFSLIFFVFLRCSFSLRFIHFCCPLASRINNVILLQSTKGHLRAASSIKNSFKTFCFQLIILAYVADLTMSPVWLCNSGQPIVRVCADGEVQIE